MSFESHRVKYSSVLRELRGTLDNRYDYKYMFYEEEKDMVYEEGSIKITCSDNICEICKKKKPVLNIIEENYYNHAILIRFCADCIASLYTTKKLSYINRAIKKHKAIERHNEEIERRQRE